MLQTIFSWNTLWWILMPIYVVACLGLIAVVLLQKGKGTGFAGAFGVGPGSETVFGPRARKSLPVRLTYIMATLFMVLSLSLSLIVGRQTRGAAPEAVAEDAAIVSQDTALDKLFGDTPAEAPAPASDGAATVAPSPEPAPADASPAEGVTEPVSTPATVPTGQ